MNRTLRLLVLSFWLLLGAACTPPAAPTVVSSAPETAVDDAAAPAATAVARPGMGPGFGRAAGMMHRHHTEVPASYAGLKNPVPVSEESLARGQAIYIANCLSCHGETGMGEGPAGEALDPVPAPIAHSSQMLSDDHLFWRISEGGAPFDTAMPVWADVLDEQARWDVINFIRNMSDAPIGPPVGAGSPAAGDEAAHRAEVLAAAVAEEAITQAEADLFERVHAVLDEHYRADQAGMEGMSAAGMQTMQRALTSQAVRDGYITQEEADQFNAIHDRLIESGLMH